MHASYDEIVARAVETHCTRAAEEGEKVGPLFCLVIRPVARFTGLLLPRGEQRRLVAGDGFCKGVAAEAVFFATRIESATCDAAGGRSKPKPSPPRSGTPDARLFDSSSRGTNRRFLGKEMG